MYGDNYYNYYCSDTEEDKGINNQHALQCNQNQSQIYYILLVNPDYDIIVNPSILTKDLFRFYIHKH